MSVYVFGVCVNVYMSNENDPSQPQQQHSAKKKQDHLIICSQRTIFPLHFITFRRACAVCVCLNKFIGSFSFIGDRWNRLDGDLEHFFSHHTIYYIISSFIYRFAFCTLFSFVFGSSLLLFALKLSSLINIGN